MLTSLAVAGAESCVVQSVPGRVHPGPSKPSLQTHPKLTTDGHRVYLDAVESAFGSDVGYAMLVKMYGNDPRESETRYSPAQCIGAMATPIIGRPDYRHISTSYVERQNLSMRMHMRRFTRLTNGFSKKVENQQHMLALYFMYYNFCRVHQTLRATPSDGCERQRPCLGTP